MRGSQVILWALFFTTNLSGCTAAATSKGGLRRSEQKGGRVLNFTDIIAGLAAKDATDSSVAASVGTLGEQVASEYRVLPKNRKTGEIRLGTRMPDEKTSTPPYVQIYLPLTTNYRLSDVEPACSVWAKIPGNPGASPFRFGCHLPVRSGSRLIRFPMQDTVRSDVSSGHTAILVATSANS